MCVDEIMEMSFNDIHSDVFAFKGTIRHHSTEKLHTHPYHQILCIKNGISILLDNKCQQPLISRNMAFIPADTPHRSTVIGKCVTFQNLFVKQDLFRTAVDSIRIFRTDKLGEALLDRLNDSNFVDVTDGVPGDCYRLFMKIVATDMLNESRFIRVPEPKQEVNIKVTSFIRDNYHRKLSMDDFRKVVPFTVRHFSRLFSAELDITIFEYLRLYRVLMASVKLFETDSSISTIAYDCGYESISIFYKDFTKYFGMSPGKVRVSSGL